MARDLVAKLWTYPHGGPGRPGIPKGTTSLVLRLAKENPTWGYRRIHELVTMGIVIAPSSVGTILKRYGVEPSPRRSGPNWAEFLAARLAHAGYRRTGLLLRPTDDTRRRPLVVPTMRFGYVGRIGDVLRLVATQVRRLRP
jgi:hypothetical protein